MGISQWKTGSVLSCALQLPEEGELSAPQPWYLLCVKMFLLLLLMAVSPSPPVYPDVFPVPTF